MGEPGRYSYVCFAHFHTGKTATDKNHPDHPDLGIDRLAPQTHIIHPRQHKYTGTYTHTHRVTDTDQKQKESKSEQQRDSDTHSHSQPETQRDIQNERQQESGRHIQIENSNSLTETLRQSESDTLETH